MQTSVGGVNTQREAKDGFQLRRYEPCCFWAAVVRDKLD